MSDLVIYTNDMSMRWADGIWSAVWQSSVLACGIFLLTLLLKRTPSSVRFCLWMLVPLRLLVMPILAFDVQLLPPETPENSVGAIVASIETRDAAVSSSFEVRPHDSFVQDEAELVLTPLKAEDDVVTRHSEDSASLSVWTCLMAAWICGVILCAIRLWMGYRGTRKIIDLAREVTDGYIFEVVNQAARMLGLSRSPRVLLTEARISPFVVGIWNPVMVLPSSFAREIGRGQLLAVFAHEAAHLRRNDFFVGWIIAACEAMYFFHPVFHLVSRKLLLEREKACDEWVLVKSRAKPSQYAQAILSAAGHRCRNELHVKPRAVIAESFTQLKHRMASIKSTIQPKAGLSVRAWVLLCTLGVLCIPGITLTARVVDSVESATPDTLTLAIEPELPKPREPIVEEQPLAKVPIVQARAQEVPDNGRFRTIHFPEDSGLGTISVRTRKANPTYRLGRESPVDGWDRWIELGSARGDVRVPIGKPVKLRIFAGGKAYLHHLSALAPDDLHTISFEMSDAGNIDNNSSKATDVQVLPYIKHLTGLRVLELNAIQTTGKGLEFIKDLRNLERLQFGLFDASFDDSGLVHLENMTSLEMLSMHVPVRDAGLKHLTPLTSLRELKLNFGNMHGPGLENLADIPSLEFLELINATNTALRYLEDATSLRSLLLYSPKKITDAATYHLAKLTHLKELKFIKGWGGDNREVLRITDAGMPALGSMTQLVSLDLGSTSVTDRGMKHIRELKNLERLGLPSSREPRTGKPLITDITLGYLAKLSNLKLIFAGSGRFTDEGLRHLSKLRRLERLVLNSASDTGATDAGLAYLAGLPKLQSLNITWSGITNRGLEHIAKVSTLRSLEIGTGINQITVGGLNALNNLDNLKRLRVDYVTQDNAVLQLGALTNLETLSILVKYSNSRGLRRDIRDEDLVSIGKLGRLTDLWVGESPYLTDKGLAPLANLKRLERLGVGGKNLSDGALTHLAGLTSLYQLTVSGDFSERGLRQLDNLTELRYLTLGSSRGISRQAEERIRENLPNLFSMNIAPMLVGR